MTHFFGAPFWGRGQIWDILTHFWGQVGDDIIIKKCFPTA